MSFLIVVLIYINKMDITASNDDVFTVIKNECNYYNESYVNFIYILLIQR